MATDPGGDAERRRLEAQLFGAFGPSYQSFDYDKFLNDPNYAQLWYGQISGPRGSDRSAAASRSAALEQILGYYQRQREGGTFEKSGGEIDVASIFEPYKEQVRQLTAQRLQLGRSEISRGASRAQEYAQESLAGTGLGRSGAAAGLFSGIQTEASAKQERLGQEERLRESERLFQIDQQVATATYAEELRKRGMNAEDITSATNFYRQIAMMSYQGMMEQAANEPSFWEEWGGVFQTLAGIGALFIPGGQAAGIGLIGAGVGTSVGGGTVVA